MKLSKSTRSWTHTMKQKTWIRKVEEALIKPVAIVLTYLLNGMTKVIKALNK